MPQFYIDSTDFSTATAIYSDALCTTPADDGYYASCGVVRQQLNGTLLPYTECIDCKGYEKPVEGELLLDLYPDAAAAYSLRQLNTSYTGAAVRVRRASDNFEQDIGFDANGDLDTSALATFCAGTDGFVVRWYDQSGNGNDAVQATTSRQPKVYDSATGVMQNSASTWPTLDKTTAVRGFDLPNLNLTEAHGFVVFEKYSISSDANGMQFQNASTNEHWGFAIGQILAGFYSTSRPTVAPNGTVSPNTPLIMSMQSTANQVYHVNGLQTYNAAHTFANKTAPKTYSNAAFDGNCPELIIYPSDQSANRAGIETNINDYYTIY